MAIDAGPAAIEPAAIDAGAAAIEPGAAIDAGGGKDCYCFSWVHLDENGEQCYATKPKCDAEFKQFGRDMKIPCEKDARGTCASFACRGAGKQCFRL